MSQKGLTDSDKAFIRDYVADATTEQEKKLRRRELAESYDMSLPAISAITAWTKIRLDRAARGEVEENEENFLLEKMEEKQIVPETDEGMKPEPEPEPEEEEKPPAIELGEDHDLAENPDYDNGAKERGWRDPYRRMVEKAWGHNNPMRGKKMLILESPQLLEWQMLERMGASEADLTIVERNQKDAAFMQEKLPKAKVINNTLFEYLASLAAQRIEDLGHTEWWREIGVQRDDPHSYFVGERKGEKYFLEQGIFDELLQEFGHVESFAALARHPNFVFFRTPAYPVTRGTFDLVSFDTKSKFETVLPEITAVHSLGLLADDNLFFTNFFGQRESRYQQEGYNVGIRYLQAEYPSLGIPDVGATLDEKRDTISTHLLRMAEEGQNVRGGVLTNNPMSVYFQAVAPDAQKEPVEALRQDIREAARKRLLHYDTINEASLFDSLMHLRIRKRIQRLFSASNYYPLNGFPIQQGVLQNGCDSFQGAFAEEMRDLFVDTVNRAQYHVDHERTRYREKSWMYADFIHFRTASRHFNIKSKLLQLVPAVFLGRARPRLVKLHDVWPVIQRRFGFLTMRDISMAPRIIV